MRYPWHVSGARLSASEAVESRFLDFLTNGTISSLLLRAFRQTSQSSRAFLVASVDDFIIALRGLWAKHLLGKCSSVSYFWPSPSRPPSLRRNEMNSLRKGANPPKVVDLLNSTSHMSSRRAGRAPSHWSWPMARCADCHIPIPIGRGPWPIVDCHILILLLGPTYRLPATPYSKRIQSKGCGNPGPVHRLWSTTGPCASPGLLQLLNCHVRMNMPRNSCV